jgi:hypothetical protein
MSERIRRALMGEKYGPAIGLRVPGNMNAALSARPRIANPDGSVSTVRSMSFGDDQGEIVLPTATRSGIVSEDQAIQDYYQNGQHLGIFDTPDNATAYAQMLHDGHEWLMQQQRRR